jgi:hypothetical protein
MALRRSTSAVPPLDKSRSVVKPDSRSSLAFFAARSVIYGDGAAIEPPGDEHGLTVAGMEPIGHPTFNRLFVGIMSCV